MTRTSCSDLLIWTVGVFDRSLILNLESIALLDSVRKLFKLDCLPIYINPASVSRRIGISKHTDNDLQSWWLLPRANLAISIVNFWTYATSKYWHRRPIITTRYWNSRYDIHLTGADACHVCDSNLLVLREAQRVMIRIHTGQIILCFPWRSNLLLGKNSL